MRLATVLAVLLLAACGHHAVGDSGAHYATAYEKKGYFVPYDEAAMHATIQVPWEHVALAYPADEASIADRCTYMGALAANSPQLAQVLTSRIGGTHLCRAGANSYLSHVAVIGSVAIPRYRTRFVYHMFNCH